MRLIPSWPSLELRLASANRYGDKSMSTRTLLVIVLVLLVIGLLPTWPYSTGWGYYPSGGGVLLLIVLLLLLFRA
jgi:Protein of unknown function (DUF3309)